MVFIRFQRLVSQGKPNSETRKLEKKCPWADPFGAALPNRRNRAWDDFLAFGKRQFPFSLTISFYLIIYTYIIYIHIYLYTHNIFTSTPMHPHNSYSKCSMLSIFKLYVKALHNFSAAELTRGCGVEPLSYLPNGLMLKR